MGGPDLSMPLDICFLFDSYSQISLWFEWPFDIINDLSELVELMLDFF